MILILGPLGGFIGSVVTYLFVSYPDNRDFFGTWCPTPVQIMLIIIGTIVFPLGIGFGFVATLISVMVAIFDDHDRRRWLNRPICGSKK